MLRLALVNHELHLLKFIVKVVDDTVQLDQPIDPINFDVWVYKWNGNNDGDQILS